MVRRYIALLLFAALFLAGCSVADVPETTQGPPIIGICLPDKTWEAESKLLSQPLIVAGYQVEVEFAGNDPEVQQLQLQNLLSRSVDCFIICAVDSLALTEQLQQAKEEAIPVLAYDRMLMHTDAVSACVAIDTYTAGQKLAQYILENAQLDTQESPTTIELFMGSPEDNNAFLFHQGLMAVLHPCLDSGKLTAPSGRTSFEDTCVQDADPNTAKSYLLDYSLEYYGDTLPDILCTGGIGMAQRCAETFPEEAAEKPLTVGISEKDSTEPMHAYACFDREQLAEKCVEWARLLLEDPDALPENVTQNNGVTDVPTFLQEPILN